MNTYTITPIIPNEIISIDLINERDSFDGETIMEAARISIDGDGDTAEALFIPGYGIGIVWKGYDEWGNYNSIEDAVYDYLNDPETYASRS